jgi:glutathione S-transferase
MQRLGAGLIRLEHKPISGGTSVAVTHPGDAERPRETADATIGGYNEWPALGQVRCDTEPNMLRLYYMPRTRSSRVLWLLAEIGAPCELMKLAPEERKSAEHLVRHPLGRVPALELDDGTIMFESAAICLQLADLHPDAGVIPPPGSAERALVYQWVLFGMTELEGPLYRWLSEVAEDSPESASRERFAQAAAALETALEGRDWLLGDLFTVADVVCASVLGSARSRGLLGEWPGLQAYVERGAARPAFIEAAAISNQPRS